MKKTFTLFFAALMAVTFINAEELVVDLSTAVGYSSNGSGTPSVAAGELTVNWTVSAAWEVAGVEIPVNRLEGVSKIEFEYKGDGQAVDMLTYLRDSEGNRWWDANSAVSLSASDWTTVTAVPSVTLWDSPSYAFGDKPMVKLAFIANPATATSGVLYLRNVKVTYVSAGPEIPTAPAVADHDTADVQALLCPAFASKTYDFTPTSWGTQWFVLSEETGVYYADSMVWDAFTNWGASSYDVSIYDKLHFDIWVPEASKIKVTFEALGTGDGGSGYKNGVEFRLNEGWNTIDADLAWWVDSENHPYSFTDMRYFMLEAYQKPDPANAENWITAEGNALALANVYFWKVPAVDYPAAPADPTMAESDVTALFAKKYQTNTLAFTPTSWGTQWTSPEGAEAYYFYTAAMGWDAFTNWGASSYNLTAYDMMHADIYVTVNSKIKVTFEALGAGDGGSGWKNGIVVDNLVANQWNSVTIDLLASPLDSYEFTDMRYLILEAFQNPDGSSAEGTPLAITNVYFYSSLSAVENVEADKVAAKRIVDGQLIIEKNGVKYTVLGTQF